MFILITIGNVTLAIIATGVLGLLLYCGWMNFQTVASIIANKEIQGKVFGICISMQSLALIIAPTIGGFLLVHGSRIPLDVGAVLMILGAICFKIFFKPKQKKTVAKDAPL